MTGDHRLASADIITTAMLDRVNGFEARRNRRIEDLLECIAHRLNRIQDDAEDLTQKLWDVQRAGGTVPDEMMQQAHDYLSSLLILIGTRGK